ncbi:hypothetical protein ACT691_11035 [Vibrio metschnikovii]
MGMADIAEVLWRSHLNHNPQNPQWADRDRFVGIVERPWLNAGLLTAAPKWL